MSEGSKPVEYRKIALYISLLADEINQANNPPNIAFDKLVCLKL
jgi:hypothetical protein